MNPGAETLRDWFPARIAWEADRPVVTWRPVGQTRFTEPFFEDALRASAADPEWAARRVRLPLDSLREVANDPTLAAGPTLAGMIFHGSRCGSTLAARTLAADPDHLVLSEAPPLDALLRSHFRSPAFTRSWQVDQLRWLVGAFARAVPTRQHLFLKFDCWHTLSWSLIQEAFPGVPGIFLYRDPIEVLLSHERQAGTQMLPGAIEPELFGWKLETILRQPRVVFRAQVLAALGEAALAAVHSGSMRLLNYHQLRDAELGGLTRWFGVSPGAAVRAAMAEVGHYHAKDPGSVYPPERSRTLDDVSPELSEAVHTYVTPIYRKLESARKNGFGLAEPVP